MEAARDIKSQYYHHTASESNYGRMVDLSQMSARDRAKAMGYDVDPRVSTYLIKKENLYLITKYFLNAGFHQKSKKYDVVSLLYLCWAKSPVLSMKY